MNDASVAEDQTAEDTPVKPRSRLVRKYALLISVLVVGVLIVSGVVEIYYSYQETKLALQRIQREKAVQAAAPAFGVTVLPLAIDKAGDFDRAFATIRRERPAGLFQTVGLGKHRRRIVELAAKSRLPAIYTRGQWVATGGLMSYGSSWPDLFRRAATYVDKILKGAKPANLPVEQQDTGWSSLSTNRETQRSRHCINLS